MRRSASSLIAVAFAAVVAVVGGAIVASGLTSTDQPGAILPIPAITTTAAPEGTVDDATLDPVGGTDAGASGTGGSSGGSAATVDPAPANEVTTGAGGSGGGKPPAPPGSTHKPTSPATDGTANRG